MKKLILALLISTNAYADVFSELTGDGARRRTAEARKQRDQARAETARIIKEIQDRRAAIAKKQNDLIVSQSARTKWLENTASFMSKEIQALPTRMGHFDKVILSLEEQLAAVRSIGESFRVYSRNAMRCSAAAEGALVLTQFAAKNEMSTGSLFTSFLSAHLEADPLQARGLGSLAWQRGYEAMYSTLPASQHLEAVLKQMASSIHKDSSLEALRMINFTVEGLEIQLRRAKNLRKSSEELLGFYQSVKDQILRERQ